MSDIFQIAGLGMLQGNQQLEAISLNAAQASQPGYRRQVAVPLSFDKLLGAVPGGHDAASTLVERLVDTKRGAALNTGRPLDLSIEANDLYFALTDGVDTWLTRSGSFRLDANGVLVGQGGLRVVGAQGDVRLPSHDVRVQADGRIEHQGTVVGALQLFRLAPGATLRAGSGALLVATGGLQPAEPNVMRLQAGVLEASNTDPTKEMLGAVKLSRRFEGLSQLVQSYDAALARTIQKLGDL